jgi:hypothetical protein
METAVLLGIVSVAVNTFGAIMYIARKYIKKSSCFGNEIEFRSASESPQTKPEWPQTISS